MRRRRFLAAASAAVAAACVPAQIASSTPSPSATGSVVPTARPTLVPTSSPSPRPDLDTLRASMRGALLRPGDAGYDDARLLYNTRFDGVRPRAVAHCADEKDVQTCVRFARDAGMPLRVRSGGHSYIGASSGDALVIDLRALSSVNLAGDRAIVGAGTALIDVYDELSAAGRGIAAGSCPTVGISGLALGGGIGVLMRAWGLTCDQLVSARVVLAGGTVATCDANNEPDLFWALRGGGGSFGVVTSLTFATHPADTLGIAFYSWDVADGAAAIDGWQRWMKDAPDELWSNLHISPAGVAVHVVAEFYGGALGARLDDLVGRVGRSASYSESGVRGYDQVMLLEAGCLGSSSGQCHLHGTTPDGVLQREGFAARSIVASAPLSTAAIYKLIERARVQGAGDVLIDSLGGAVSRLAPDATAFPHRTAFAVLQLYAGGSPTPWLNDTFAALRPLVGTGAYANYADAELSDWQTAYYGPNYPRLQRVKRQYDPDRLFDLPQAI